MRTQMIRALGVLAVVCTGVLTILGSGAVCPPGTNWRVCGKKALSFCCEDPKSPKSCCVLEESYASLSQVPPPDLAFTDLDGLVDFGHTKLKVESLSDGDSFETTLKGRVAIKGGVCAQPQCPLEVLLVALQPVQAQPKSAGGKTVSEVFVRNANAWTGTRHADSMITLDPNAALAMEATVDGKRYTSVIPASAGLKGALYYNQPRPTDWGPRVNNRITVAGTFSDQDTKVLLTITIWAADCRPVIEAGAECTPDIESGPGRAVLTAKFARLGSLQNSLDLCEGLANPNPETFCRSGQDLEFPSFSCGPKLAAPPKTPVETAKELGFQWMDAAGHVFSSECVVVKDQCRLELEWMPVFPVTVSVVNKWGKTASQTIASVKYETNCPKQEGLAAFGVVAGNGARLAGTPNWASVFNASEKRYEIGLSGESYHLHDYATVVTPSFAIGKWGFCQTDSVEGQLLVSCHDVGGKPFVPASLGFAVFKAVAAPPKAVAAFGVVSGSGNKESGSPNWVSVFNASEKRYEISISGESYHLGSHTTVVTPSFQTGEAGFCQTSSVGGQLLVRCHAIGGAPSVPVSLSFVTFKAGPTLPKGVAAFGVLAGSGSKQSGSPNWASSFNASKKLYEIGISGVSYHYAAHTTVVTPSFETGKTGFCQSRSVEGKLLIACQDEQGSPTAPAALAYVVYRRP